VLYTLILGARALVSPALFRLTRMEILELLPKAAVTAVVPEEQTRWAGPEDLRLLEALGHETDVLQRRLAAGARAFVLAERQEILAYVWFHRPVHDEEDLGVRFVLGPGEMWLFDAMVRAEHRGRGFYPRLLRAASHDLGRQGVSRILIAIDRANRNSLRAHHAAGAESIGMLLGLRMFGFTLVRCRGRLRAAWTGTTGYVEVLTSTIAQDSRYDRRSPMR
jgi:GNAT superfamily N-acetyltransferase